MNELHLFAGSGGGILGGILLGHTCVCAVELEPYCRKVLLQRQRDGILPPFPIWDDIKTFDGKPWRDLVDIVAGGFPCKGISIAGSGAGLDHEESGLWREQARIIGDIRPPFVFVENSPALTVRGGLRVIGDLAALGYDCRWGVISAADAIWSYGVPCLDHERARIWILGSDGNAVLDRCDRPDAVEKFYHHQDWTRPACEQRWNPIAGAFEPAGETVAHANRGRKLQPQGRQQNQRGRTGDRSKNFTGTDTAVGGRGTFIGSASRQTGHASIIRENFDAARSHAESIRSRSGLCETGTEQHGDFFADVGCAQASADADHAGCKEQRQSIESVTGQSERDSWWAAEPGVGRMVNGLAHRVDRLTAIGNGQVSAVVKLAFNTLK